MWIIDFYKLEEYPKKIRKPLKDLLNKTSEIGHDLSYLKLNPIIINTLIEYGVLVEEETFKKRKIVEERKEKIEKVLDNKNE